MGRGASKPAEAFAQAVSAEVRAEIGRQRLSMSEVERRAELSHAYLWKRLDDQLPLNLNDVAALAGALNIEPGELIARAEEHARPAAPVIEGRFKRMGSGREFTQNAAAQLGKRSIFDEQEQRDD